MRPPNCYAIWNCARPRGVDRRRPQQRAAGARRRQQAPRDYAGRGVVTPATYEARALGVFSAMGMKAAALAPDAIPLPTDFDSYRHYSRLFKAAVRTFTDRIEDRGIDEIDVGCLADNRPLFSASVSDQPLHPCRARYWIGGTTPSFSASILS
ncbi:hypothetical protein OKW45_000871 [Paraburkholderia sp. WSM4175]